MELLTLALLSKSLYTIILYLDRKCNLFMLIMFFNKEI